ncbi:Hypothetical protein A7982_05383 [Minicystis rosea]|nr:Hypothetical protein A7982_05383 [Minicystis rosea]
MGQLHDTCPGNPLGTPRRPQAISKRCSHRRSGVRAPRRSELDCGSRGGMFRVTASRRPLETRVLTLIRILESAPAVGAPTHRSVGPRRDAQAARLPERGGP